MKIGFIGLGLMGWPMAERLLGDLRGRRVLVIGAGKMADLAAVNLVARGAEGMVVANVSLVSVDGDIAIVSVDFDIDGQASTEQFHLQRVGGEWKLDLEASA